VAKEYGIVISYENMPFVDLPIHTAVDVADFARKINSDNFKVCLDIGHCIRCGEDLYNAVRYIGKDLLFTLHVHDNYGGKRAPGCDLHQYPYWGNVNFDGVISALLEIGYKGTFNFEVDNPVRRSGAIPFVKDGVPQEKLSMMPPELRVQMETYLYAIGKQMLETYDCFEE
jgi:sugar phosphate isomerase/epimerase